MKLNELLHSLTDEGYTVTFSKKHAEQPTVKVPVLHIKLERLKPNGSGKESLEIPCLEKEERMIIGHLNVCRKEFIRFHVDKDHKKNF